MAHPPIDMLPLSTVSADSNDSAVRAPDSIIVSSASSAAAEPSSDFPHGVKLVPFLDVVPFSLTVQRILGWYMRDSRKRTLWIILLSLMSVAAPLALSCVFLPAAFSAALIVGFCSGVTSTLVVAAISDGPWVLLDNDDPDDQKQRVKKGQPVTFIFTLGAYCMFFWSIYDIGGRHSFDIAIGSASLSVVTTSYSLTVIVHVANAGAQQMESIVDKLNEQMQCGALTFSEAVDWAIAISQLALRHNGTLVPYAQMIVLFNAATSVLYLYTFFVIYSHPIFVVLAVSVQLSSLELFLRLARFNSKVEKLRFQVNLMRSLNDKVFSCLLSVRLLLCLRAPRAIACLLVGHVVITVISWP